MFEYQSPLYADLAADCFDDIDTSIVIIFLLITHSHIVVARGDPIWQVLGEDGTTTGL